MTLQKIVAPANRGVRVQVYEPRQTPEQEEVILDEFDLEAGEEREYEIRSATAGYRTFDRARHDAVAEPRDEKMERVAREDEERLEEVRSNPGMAPESPATVEEVQAGEKAAAEHQEGEPRGQRRPKATPSNQERREARREAIAKDPKNKRITPENMKRGASAPAEMHMGKGAKDR